MSKSILSSEKQKATVHIRAKKMREYWKKERGGYDKEDLISEFTLYKRTVYLQSEITYRRFKDTINPNNLSRKEYHVDHKYSVMEGFKNNTPPYILASIHNLELVKAKDNLSKGSKCSIDKETLFDLFFSQEVAEK
jgi:hypothetical protein